MDGYYPSCKECKKKTKGLTKQKDPEKWKRLKRESDERNKGHIKEYRKKYQKEYYEKNRNSIIQRTSNYRKENPQVQRRASEKYRKANLGKSRNQYRNYYWSNLEMRRSLAKRWRKENPEKAREQKRRHYERMKEDPQFKLIRSIRRGIWRSLKGIKSTHITLLDFSIADLKKHLESQFKSGMSWDNYGDWHIDHKIPIAAFNFSIPKHPDFTRCWSLKNLQPLWAKENCSKQGKLPDAGFQPSLKME